jgi:hypothetical protein
MAHIYMLFDFATDEEKAQLARHQLEVWKQAFRLDKKLLYKFERAAKDSSDAADDAPAEKPKAKGKSKANGEAAEPKGSVKLLVRLGFSNHEKITGERWVARIPNEPLFKAAHPRIIKPDDKNFADTEQQFEELA